MNKRIFLIFTILLLLITNFSRADEGMWLPLFLSKYNIEDMQQKGFKLSAEDIYDVNSASMNDAVMIFGGGCTAELISAEGLIITNHHCGFGRIQKHSTLEHDYLTNGFWAMNRQDELTNPGLTVTFLVYMEDVTEQILKNVKEKMSEAERQIEIEKAISIITEEAILKSENKYIAEVEPFFQGNQYFLFVSQIYKDVRLVGAPPSAIGKFGGDTDNWMWPRHTGDFSLFRIYADENNQPAEYSPTNVPLKSKKFFPISLKGVNEGDFTLVFGYPGSTEEYEPSYSLELTTQVVNPARIQIRDTKLSVINLAMQNDKHTRIKYASKQSGIANGWKKWQGENNGLERLNAIDKKQKLELKFQEWTEQDKEHTKKYGNIISDYKNYYAKLTPFELAYHYWVECVYYLETMKIVRNITDKLFELNKYSSEEEIEETRKKARKSAEHFFKDYDQDVDKEIFAKIINLYYNNLDKKFHPLEYITLEIDFKNDIEAYTNYIYENSIFLNQDTLYNFIDNYTPNPKRIKKQLEETEKQGFFKRIFNKKDTETQELQKIPKQYSNKDILTDPLYTLYKSYMTLYFSKIQPELSKITPKIDSLNRVYMSGLMEMQTNKLFYPDANFTLRVAYGNVMGYEPKNGVYYKHFTTLDGIIEKDNPEIYDYKVPEKLKELYANKDFGRYADKDGTMHVCFIANNHTSGGNSGSPVINAEGHLIGINFDRCWEGTMSDIMFDPDRCRNITLDIRYALFIIDKLGGASYLIDEMEIIE